MKKQIKKFYVSLVIVFVIYCVFNPSAYAYVWQNWRECANSSLCTGTFQMSSSIIKTYIEDSASFLLLSHSDYQVFLNRIEMSESNCIDNNELKEIIYNAIENMEKTKVAYTNLIMISEKTPYNQEIIDKLKKFDYDAFRVRFRLIESIFEEVKNFLIKGDISGMDNSVLNNMSTILGKLYEIKSILDKNQMIEISILWRLNQNYAEIHLFGQYVAEVFRSIIL